MEICDMLRWTKGSEFNEGVNWPGQDANVCRLLHEQNNVGILAMLDEECLRPGQVSDQTFLEKLNQTCWMHEHYESRGCKKSQSDKNLPHDAFRLQHYAGAVGAVTVLADSLGRIMIMAWNVEHLWWYFRLRTEWKAS